METESKEEHDELVEEILTKIEKNNSRRNVREVVINLSSGIRVKE